MNKMLTDMQLIHGDDFIAKNGIVVKHPKLEHLIRYSSTDVYGFAQLFCLQPQDIMIDLWANGIDFETLTDFDLFLILYSNGADRHQELFFEFMGVWFWEYCESENEKWLRGYDKEGVPIAILDSETHSELAWFFKKITCFENAEKPKYASNKTKEKLLDLEVESRDDEKQTEDLMPMYISALVWGNTCGYNWKNIWELNFFQFNSGLRHLDKIKHTQALWGGYYSGTIEMKKIPKKDLDWKTI